jgi:redox-sensitive bicupin YhaK (pirin superfamily)
VLVGDFAELTSPARHDTPLVGVDLALHRPTTVPLRRDFEYAVVVLEGAAGVHGKPLLPGKLGYLGRGRDELRLDVREAHQGTAVGWRAV